jgi:hypothetical protein
VDRKQVRQILKENPSLADIHKAFVDRGHLLAALEDIVKFSNDPNMPMKELIKRGKAALSAVRYGYAKGGRQ